MTGTILAIAKLLLSAYFSYARLNNATEEELNSLFEEEKVKFLQNEPSKLPKV